MSTKISEAAIQRCIMDYLAAEHILAFRQNTGQAKMGERFVRFGVKGMADILAFKNVGTQFEDGGVFVHPMIFWRLYDD